MSEEVISPVASATPSAPVQAAPSAAPAVVSAPQTPTPVSEPTAAQSPTVEAVTPVATEAKAEAVSATETVAPSVAEVKPVEPTKSLLGESPVKPEATKPALEVVKSDVAPVEAPAEVVPVPVYDDFKLPEGFVNDAPRISEFKKTLADLELTTKADHKFVQEFGQKMVDTYTTELTNAIKQIEINQKTAFEKQRSDWLEATKKDPEIGGNRLDTTVNSAHEFIRTHGGTPAQQQEIRDLMKTVGIDNHPAMIRLLAMANRNVAEGRPLVAKKPAPASLSKSERMYGKMK